MSKKKRKFLDVDEEDPTSGIINLTDCMLVLAVGFLVFAVMALSSNPSLLSESTTSSQNTVSVTTGETINDTPENGSGSGEGYQEMGTVYKDPETGKLIMVK
ncbi:DUF2149 domain-containing protein [Methanobacterium alcaliphilum]|uniref:DUF2149 domain-containing protein n=1 Tax=Methanobacterium alcaliphilum TaxID=392018 RepID=UPI00200A7440|nr:DUF2149 domain-containing protein [Methanobacterium alcaliphilum]MCK9151887.1 DUF2149 domain-containing protein [Methanobacterium alcaliphilum]